MKFSVAACLAVITVSLTRSTSGQEQPRSQQQEFVGHALTPEQAQHVMHNARRVSKSDPQVRAAMERQKGQQEQLQQEHLRQLDQQNNDNNNNKYANYNWAGAQNDNGDGNGYSVLTNKMSFRFNTCLSLPTEPSEDMYYLMQENGALYDMASQGAVVTQASYVLFDLCETGACGTESSIDEVFLVDLATYLNAMRYYPTRQSKYCAACQGSYQSCYEEWYYSTTKSSTSGIEWNATEATQEEAAANQASGGNRSGSSSSNSGYSNNAYRGYNNGGGGGGYNNGYGGGNGGGYGYYGGNGGGYGNYGANGYQGGGYQQGNGYRNGGYNNNGGYNYGGNNRYNGGGRQLYSYNYRNQQQYRNKQYWQYQWQMSKYYEVVECTTCIEMGCFPEVTRIDTSQGTGSGSKTTNWWWMIGNKQAQNATAADAQEYDIQDMNSSDVYEWLLDYVGCQETTALINNGEDDMPLYAGFMCNADGTGVEIAMFLDEYCTAYTSAYNFADVAAENDETAYLYAAQDIVTYPFLNEIDCSDRLNYMPTGTDVVQDQSSMASYTCRSLFAGDNPTLQMSTCTGESYSGGDSGFYTYVLSQDDLSDPYTVCDVINSLNSSMYQTVYRSGGNFQYNNVAGASSGKKGFIAGLDEWAFAAVGAIMVAVALLLGGLVFLWRAYCCDCCVGEISDSEEQDARKEHFIVTSNGSGRVI